MIVAITIENSLPYKLRAKTIKMNLHTLKECFSAFSATSLGFAPASMASENSLNALAVIVARTVLTSDTFCTTMTFKLIFKVQLAYLR